jgi:hypothetical protein
VYLRVDDDAPPLWQRLRRRWLGALQRQRQAGAKRAVEKIATCKHDCIPLVFILNPQLLSELSLTTLSSIS